MAGLTPTGFQILRLADVIAALNASAVTNFQDLVQSGDTVNTDANSILGRLIGMVGSADADLWELAQLVYSSFNINAATGISLDNLVMLGGVTRKQQTATTVLCDFTGTLANSVSAGSYITSTATGQQYTVDNTVTFSPTASTGVNISVNTVANSTVYSFTFSQVGDVLGIGTIVVSITSASSGATSAAILSALESAINTSYSAYMTASIDGSGNLQVTTLPSFGQMNASVTSNLTVNACSNQTIATCTTLGAFQEPIGSLTVITTPNFGWTLVTNRYVGIVGQDVETDDQLRARYLQEKFSGGANTFESMYSAVLNIPDVTACVIYENDTDTTLTTPYPPVPPHAFNVIVEAGGLLINTAIAQAIWQNKPAGVGTYCNPSTGVSVGITDSQNVPHTIKFDYAGTTPIYIALDINITSAFPTDGVTQIQTALVNWAEANYSIGTPVWTSQLYSAINTVPGFYVNTFYIDTSPSPSSSPATLTISKTNIATIIAANISVTTHS